MPGVAFDMTSRSTSGPMRLSRLCTFRIAEALLVLGQRHDDRAIEATGAQQRRVEDVGTVGGGEDDDAFAGLEAVHLGEHLVERLLTLVVPATEAGAALAADRVDLVDEDDGPTHLAGLLEEVADAAGADADEHLHEVATGDRQEADACLAGDGPGEQRLAGTWRTDEQDALRHSCTDLAEPLGHPQEVDDFGDLLLDAFVAGDVGERRRRLVGGVRLGPATPDRHDVAHLARSTALHPHEEADQQHERQQQAGPAEQPVGARSLGLELDALSPEVRRSARRSGKLLGAVVVNFSPLSSSPVMLLV